MDITLAKDVEDFLQEQIREGACTDASVLVNDLLRTLCDQRVNPITVSPELKAWLLKAADQPATSPTGADFDGIRQRVRDRVKPSAQ